MTLTPLSPYPLNTSTLSPPPTHIPYTLLSPFIREIGVF